MVSIDKIIAYENGMLDHEAVVEMFADLVKSGDAWRLQGSYGRTARLLIENGCITRTGEVR